MRSSFVRDWLFRWVWTNLTPRNSRGPDRLRERLGKTSWRSVPTMTASTVPRRLMRRPICRRISCDSSVQILANSGVMTLSTGTRRRNNRSNLANWLALRPLKFPMGAGIPLPPLSRSHFTQPKPMPPIGRLAGSEPHPYPKNHTDQDGKLATLLPQSSPHYPCKIPFAAKPISPLNP